MVKGIGHAAFNVKDIKADKKESGVILPLSSLH